MVNALTWYKGQLINTTETPQLTLADGDSLSNDIVLSEDEQALVLIVTEDQYTQLLSSAWNGVYTTYPQDYIEVIYPLIKAGKLVFCEQVAICLTDEESPAYQALLDAIANQTADASRNQGQTWNNFGLADGKNPTCDLDILWAQCFGVVDTLHIYNQEFFAKLEVATNTYEFIAEVIGDITGIDETSIDALLAWIAKVQDDIEENYDSQATLSWRQERACQIFCLVQQQTLDCLITPTIIFDLFADELSASVTIQSLISDILDYLVGGAWSGTQIADFMMLAQAGFRSALGRWLEYVGWAGIDTIASLYTNDANDDWTLLCDECYAKICITDWDEAELTIATGTVNGSFGNPAPSGQWVAITPTGSDNYAFRFEAEIDLGAEYTLVNVDFDLYTSVVGGGAANGFMGLSIKTYDSSHTLVNTYNLNGTYDFESWQNVEQAITDTAQYVELAMFRASPSLITGTAYADNWCVEYDEG